MKYHRLDQERPVVHHQGTFRKQLSLWEAVALIVSGTVGAGVLGIPYAIAKVGLIPGVIYIIGVGLLVMGLHLLLGEVAVRTGENMQLAGLARRYLGKSGEIVMDVVFYIMTLGALVVYIIGVGNALQAIFGGETFLWSMIFFVLATPLLLRGLRTIKTAELLLTIAIFAVVVCIGAWSSPHLAFPDWQFINTAALFFPYGILLFAFNGTTAIPEAHALLGKRNVLFKHAVIISSVITIVFYTVFALVVVGVTGFETTEVATIGLGLALGPTMVIFGNLFAVLAMATSYLLLGVSLRDSLHWDYKVQQKTAGLLVSFLPLTIFFLGVKEFIKTIEVIGGVFVSIEMFLILFIYLQARRHAARGAGTYRVHHALWMTCMLLIAFLVGGVYSVFSIF